MSDRFKKIFLAFSIVVPFLLYAMYYYGMMVKNAPYKFSEFKEITFNYGLGDSLVNKYNSRTMEYQYVNKRDSIIKKKVKLTKDDLLILHRKAADLGFWNFPENMLSDSSIYDNQAAHYYVEFKYKRKTKHIDFDANYMGKPQLKDAARRLIEIVDSRIKEAESR